MNLKTVRLNSRESERYPSGQRDQTVNLAAYAFEGSNPSLSTIFKKYRLLACNLYGLKACVLVAQDIKVRE